MLKTKILTLFYTVLFSSCLAVGHVTVTASFLSATGNLNSVKVFPGRIFNTTSCCSANVKMEIVSTSIPSGWGVSICDPTTCFPVGTSLANFTLNALDSGYVGVDFHIDSTAGIGTASIRWTNLADTTNIINMTYTVTVSATGIVTVENSIIMLSQNYPNPFSSSTTIKYHLEQPKGKIIITDVQGKEITEYILNPASEEITINDKLRPGIYFYSLYYDDKIVRINKMIVE